jgi:hypothetical protein
VFSHPDDGVPWTLAHICFCCSHAALQPNAKQLRFFAPSTAPQETLEVLVTALAVVVRVVRVRSPMVVKSSLNAVLLLEFKSTIIVPTFWGED